MSEGFYESGDRTSFVVEWADKGMRRRREDKNARGVEENDY